MNDTRTGEDRRIRRTKKMLSQGLMQLMQKKQITDISVRELAEEVDITCATFYRYYRDVPDLLRSIENDLLKNLDDVFHSVAESDKTPFLLSSLRAFFSFAKQNQRKCQVLLGPNGDISFLNQINNLLLHHYLKGKHFINGGPAAEADQYYYSFASFGCIGMVRAWLDDGCHKDVAFMVNAANTLITSFFH